MSNATSTPPAASAPGGTGQPPGATTAPSPGGGAVPTTPPGRGPSSPAPDAAALGERRERAGLALTVLQASGRQSVNQYLPPQGDNYYLILEVVIENVSLERARYQRHQFDLRDAAGRSYQPSIFAPEPALPTGGDLSRGQRVQGNIAFELPRSATELFVSYNADPVAGTRETFQVRLGDATAYAPPPGTAGGATPPAGTAAPARTPTAAGGRAPTAPPAVGGQPYRDPRGRFSLVPPEGWTQNTSTGTTVRFDAPDNAATMNLNLEDVSQIPGLTLDQYDAAIERQLGRQFPGYTTVSKEQVTVAGQPAYRRTITATVSGTPLRIIALYLLQDETAHVLIMAAPEAQFATFAPAFEAIIDSYRVG